MAAHPTVFISYSHDSESHKQQVLELSQRLRGDGFDCEIDQYHAAPAEGWIEWMNRHLRESDFVLLVWSEGYGSGKGTRHELASLNQQLYDQGEAGKIVPLVFGRESRACIPDRWRTFTSFDVATDAGYGALVAHLRGEAPVEKAPIGGGAGASAIPAGTGQRILQREDPLTITLQAHDGTLVRAYSLLRREDFYQARDADYLETLRAAADAADVARGDHLFDLLFGDDWYPLSRLFFGREGESPTLREVRVRIAATDRRFLELPWTDCAWHGESLCRQGWTFELAKARQIGRRLEHLETPCDVLMVANGADRQATAIRHSLEGILHRSSESPTSAGPFRLLSFSKAAKDRDAVPFPVALIRGSGGADAAGRLIFTNSSGQGGLPLDALIHGGQPPTLILVQTFGEAPLAGLPPGVSALIHLRHGEPDEAARHALLAIWRGIFEEGKHPVRAFCSLTNSQRKGAVWCDYGRWELEARPASKHRLIRARLDRRAQRERMLSVVDELLASTRRRVTCVVAFGDAGNLADLFTDQMVDTLEDRAERAQVLRQDLELPPGRDEMDPARIREHFRDYCSLQPSQPIRHYFSRVRRHSDRVTPLHLLNWQCYGRSKPGRSLLPAIETRHLQAWLEFCCVDLVAACPKEMRILAVLALEAGRDLHDRLEKWLEQRPGTPPFSKEPSFDVVPLPPLTQVTEADLQHFLRDPENSGCPESIRQGLPARIIAKTGGDFEATVELLEDAELDNRWLHYYETLEAPAPPPDEHFEIR